MSINKHEGEHKAWDDNGQLIVQEFYSDGKLQGERKEWYYNGQLYGQGYVNGQLRVQEFYRDGMFICDLDFSIKMTWLSYKDRLRKRVRTKYSNKLFQRLIPDLANLCAQYII